MGGFVHNRMMCRSVVAALFLILLSGCQSGTDVATEVPETVPPLETTQAPETTEAARTTDAPETTVTTPDDDATEGPHPAASSQPAVIHRCMGNRAASVVGGSGCRCWGALCRRERLSTNRW